MSYIICTDNCRYQADGMCTLEHCTVQGQPSQRHPCVHYLPLSPGPEVAAPEQCSVLEAMSNAGMS
jgi:hypothetical protein